MYDRRKALRITAAVLLLAAGIRLGIAGFFQPRILGGFVRDLMFFETGRALRPERETTSESETAPPDQNAPTQGTAGRDPVLPIQPQRLTFTGADLTLVSLQYQCDYRPNLEELMEKALSWDLQGQEPAVLILHSHGTEAYAGENYETWGDYRTLDDSCNVIAIGDEVARILENNGIRVIHDRTAYDYPDYNSAYSGARAAVSAWLEKYPSICLVLDLHRDASGGDAGQLVTAATVGGQKSAQLMMVVGTDANGSYHPQWKENLALALKLSALLEQGNPGICRPVDLRSQRFNMDLSPGSLIVEVGAAGNTYEEARIAANALAQAVVALAKGAN